MRSLICLIAMLSLAGCPSNTDIELIPTDTASDSATTGDTDSGDDTAADIDAEPDVLPPDEAPDTGTEDIPSIDVSEAFCDCDDDCLPLGDGSLCNGTVCTFGVPGIPCDGPDVGPPDVEDVGEDLSADLREDADAVEDTIPDTELDPDTTPEADAPAVDGIEVVYDTAGGFTGEGARDIRLVGGVMFLGGSVSPCDDTLTPEQTLRLIDAAGIVEWDSTAASYRPPDNPTCCCDQFFYALTVTLDNDSGSSAIWEVDWCDESIGSLLPLSIETFIDVLSSVADEVMATCF